MTGLHNVRLVATEANGYAAGTNIALVLTAGTVDSVPVRETIAQLSIERASPEASRLLGPYNRKYAQTLSGGYLLYFPVDKIGGGFALNADWTPIAGDVKVMIDGAASANVGTLPTATAIGAQAYWALILTGAEVTGKSTLVSIQGTGIRPMMLLVETFGDDLAMYPADIGAVNDDLAQLHDDWADGGRLDVILDARASQTSVDDVPTAAENADAVWDEAIAGHAAAGSTGEALSDAGGAGTPPTVGEIADAVWDELIAGHAGVGSTGEALSDAGGAGTPPTVNEIADEVQTRTIAAVTIINGLAANTVNASALAADAVAEIQSGLSTLNDNGVRIAIGLASPNLDTQLGNLPTNAELNAALGTADDATLAALVTIANAIAALPQDKTGYALTVAERAAIVDKLLLRSIAGGADGGRTVQDALRALRNKTEIAGGTLTVYAEDDATPAWTATATRTAGDPLSAIDPA